MRIMRESWVRVCRACRTIISTTVEAAGVAVRRVRENCGINASHSIANATSGE